MSHSGSRMVASADRRAHHHDAGPAGLHGPRSMGESLIFLGVAGLDTPMCVGLVAFVLHTGWAWNLSTPDVQVRVCCRAVIQRNKHKKAEPSGLEHPGTKTNILENISAGDCTPPDCRHERWTFAARSVEPKRPVSCPNNGGEDWRTGRRKKKKQSDLP